MERKSFDLGSRHHPPGLCPGTSPCGSPASGSVALFLTRQFRGVLCRYRPDRCRDSEHGAALEPGAVTRPISPCEWAAYPNRGNLFLGGRIGRIAYAPYASHGFSFAPMTLRRRRQRSDRSFIGFKMNPRRGSQSSWLYEIGQQGRFPLRVNELHLRYEGVRRGSGITLLPCHLGYPDPELVRVALTPSGAAGGHLSSHPCDGTRGASYPARGRCPDQALRGACSGIDGQPAAQATAGLEPLGRRAQSAFRQQIFFACCVNAIFHSTFRLVNR